MNSLKTFRLPSAAVVGLTVYNKQLVVMNNETTELCFFTPSSMVLKQRYESGIFRPKLICADEEFIYVYDEVYQRVNRLEPKSQHVYPFGGFQRANHPYHGMAVDKQRFYLLVPDLPWYAAQKVKLQVYDRHTKVLLHSFDAPTYGCRGLHSDGTVLYTMDFATGVIYSIHGETGIVIDEEHTGRRHLLDIALHGKSYYTLDVENQSVLSMRKTSKLYDLYGAPLESAITVSDVYMNNGPNPILSWETQVLKPENYLHQNLVSPVKIEPATSLSKQGFWPDKDYAFPLVHHRDMAPGQRRENRTSFRIRTRDLRYHLRVNDVADANDIPEPIKQRFLLKNLRQHGDAKTRKILDMVDAYLEFSKDSTKEKAKDIVGKETNPLLQVLKLFRYIIDEIDYTLPYQMIPLSTIMEEKKGSCGNHSALLSSLCQSLGLPTRSLIGYCIWDYDARAGYLDHEIPEVYIPPFGFIPIDTSRFMSVPNSANLPGEDLVNFGKLDRRFVVFGFSGVYDTESARFRYLNKRKIVTKGFATIDAGVYVDWQTEEKES